jgi:uncharacterized protein
MFKPFPALSTVNLSDRQRYESLMYGFPPISDLSFTTLMIWWNFNDSLKVAELNGNLVVSYYLPGDEKNSGLALVGRNKVDESIVTVLSELESQGQEPRLVHVPEFVVRCLRDPSLFQIAEERDYNEYIISSNSLYPLENTDHNTRRKIKKFISVVGEDAVEVKQLDLTLSENQKLLLDSAAKWRATYGARNDGDGVEMSILPTSIRGAKALGMENVCLYVNGELQGFAVFQLSYDKQYVILNHVKAKPDVPRIFDYMTYLVFKWAVDNKIPYINLEMDLGIPGLRQHKSELKPVSFFKKYQITLKNS